MATKPKLTPISNQLRRLIKECGITQYRLSKETNVARSTLSKFLNDPEFSLSLDSIDKLGTYLAWVVAPQESAKPSRRTSKARGRKAGG